MAAFERVLSGIPEMDKALDNIRLGLVTTLFSGFLTFRSLECLLILTLSRRRRMGGT